MLHGEPCTLRGRVQSPARHRWWTAMLWQKPCTVLISTCSPSDVGHVQCTTSTGRPAACFVCQDSMYQEFIAGEAVHCLPSAGMSLPEALVIRGGFTQQRSVVDLVQASHASNLSTQGVQIAVQPARHWLGAGSHANSLYIYGWQPAACRHHTS